MPADIFGHVEPPSGTIGYWDDDPANLPSGWVVCDGNNGTPNLLDKFTKCVSGTNTDPGSAGGQDSFTLSNSQMATHHHDSKGTDNVGSHDHGLSSDSVTEWSTNYNEEPADGSTNSYNTTSSGNHSHSINDDSTGSGNSVDNRPQFYEIVPIMKT